MAVAVDGRIQGRDRSSQDISKVQKLGVGDFVQFRLDLGEAFPAEVPSFDLNFYDELRLRTALLRAQFPNLRPHYVEIIHTASFAKN